MLEVSTLLPSHGLHKFVLGSQQLLTHSCHLDLVGQRDTLQLVLISQGLIAALHLAVLPQRTQTLQSLWSRLSKDSLKGFFFHANKYYSPKQFLTYCLKLELVENNFKSFISNTVSYDMKYLPLSLTGDSLHYCVIQRCPWCIPTRMALE